MEKLLCTVKLGINLGGLAYITYIITEIEMDCGVQEVTVYFSAENRWHGIHTRMYLVKSGAYKHH